jgi:hypothetical protein
MAVQIVQSLRLFDRLRLCSERPKTSTQREKFVSKNSNTLTGLNPICLKPQVEQSETLLQPVALSARFEHLDIFNPSSKPTRI